MFRYIVRIEYNGTDFHGWQVQPNAKTIQGVCEQKLSMLLNKTVSIVGCGRTDTGVHASDFYFHFDTEKEIETPQKLQYQLNSVLPHSIAVNYITLVSNDFHARFSATKRTYQYHITFKKPVFNSNKWWLKHCLDVSKMREAGAVLFNHKDFTSFSKLHTDVATNNCDIFEFEIEENDSGIIITLSANRFLRNMVRAIVGTLVEIGTGKRTVADFSYIIEQKDRGLAGASAPACGLFLTNIEYPKALIKAI